MSAGADSLKSILFALGANFLIALAKTAGAVFTGSSSMLAEAIHSYADCANQALLLWGMREGKRRPSRDHPLGHGKAIYFWSFIVALMLFSMGGLFSIYEGIHKLQATEPLEYAWVAIGILVFGIAAESVSLWGCLREVNKDRGRAEPVALVSRARARASCSSSSPKTSRRSAAWSLALVFIGLTLATGNPVWDAVGSICIGVLLVLVAVLVGIEVKALLIGQSVEARDPRADARASRRPRRGRERLQPAHPAAGQRRHGRRQGEDAAGRVGGGVDRGDQSRRAQLSRAPSRRCSGCSSSPTSPTSSKRFSARAGRAVVARALIRLSRTGRPGRPGCAPAAS